MRTLLIAAAVGFVLSLSFQTASAQDVCCVMSQVSGTNVTTMAALRSAAGCSAADPASGTKPCSSAPDPENTCSQIPATKQCQVCGYFWTGSACLTEEPKKDKKGSGNAAGPVAKATPAPVETPPPQTVPADPTPISEDQFKESAPVPDTPGEESKPLPPPE
jgi:hypothetical protein